MGAGVGRAAGEAQGVTSRHLSSAAVPFVVEGATLGGGESHSMTVNCPETCPESVWGEGRQSGGLWLCSFSQVCCLPGGPALITRTHSQP